MTSPDEYTRQTLSQKWAELVERRAAAFFLASFVTGWHWLAGRKRDVTVRRLTK